ncbi:MAG: UDP-glucose/GDP-mannose dehydrogenase family protein [Endomicrobium sp.]|jgi:UDPglucose 6-dehydrogenase|nr:UDP-glucose/GDP-mannose dehydrogenase family protein [Endomicrobium sp.]
MDIAIIGTGYVGLVSGACFADIGHNVICVDMDETKIRMLENGHMPIYEPGISELIADNVKSGKLLFSNDITIAVQKSSVIFIAVGTPAAQDGSADLKYVFMAAEAIAKAINSYKVIATKSTVPVGTSEKIRELIKRDSNYDFDVVSNPEFLKEGSAINDFMKPDRIVIGADCAKAAEIMQRIYEPFTKNFHPIIVIDVKSAELTKYASNSFLATKISFINEIANICEKTHANIDSVRKAMGADKRIGYEFFYNGIGYGGSCFPKDIRALISTAKSSNYVPHILEAVEKVNEFQKLTLFNKIVSHYKDKIEGLTFAVWGLSFKPNTDDIREAPSINVINKLLDKGAEVKAFDPVAMNNAKEALKGRIYFMQKKEDALDKADALIIFTEWNEFKNIPNGLLKSKMKGNVVFDGRNLCSSVSMKEQGMIYYSMGRL